MSEKIPEVIYLQWYGLDERDMHNAKCDAEMLGNPYPDPIEQTWCTDRQYDTDVMYRRVRKQPKDAMAAVDKLEQTIDALIKERDWYHERLHKAEYLLRRAWKTRINKSLRERPLPNQIDAFLAKQEKTDG